MHKTVVHSANKLLFTEADYQQHNCGAMDAICQFCKAKYFVAEIPKDECFNNCCHKGKIAPFRRQYPLDLKSLISDPENRRHQDFKENIRSFNSSLSFVLIKKLHPLLQDDPTISECTVKKTCILMKASRSNMIDYMLPVFIKSEPPLHRYTSHIIIPIVH